MNKFKLTVFVEGLAEQIFVRQLVYAWFGYDQSRIGFNCLSLHSKQYEYAPYDIGDDTTSECFYRIINTGNDNKVFQQVVELSNDLLAKGFGILGLRDMYSQTYLAQAKKRQSLTVHPDLNDRFIQSVNTYLDENLSPEVRVNANICFAIMEVEAWILAMKGYAKDDVESIFHPAETLKAEFEGYDKHGTQIEGLVSTWQKEDVLALYNSNKCPSFNKFLNLLVPQEYWD